MRRAGSALAERAPSIRQASSRASYFTAERFIDDFLDLRFHLLAQSLRRLVESRFDFTQAWLDHGVHFVVEFGQRERRIVGLQSLGDKRAVPPPPDIPLAEGGIPRRLRRLA